MAHFLNDFCIASRHSLLHIIMTPQILALMYITLRVIVDVEQCTVQYLNITNITKSWI